jgi:hypothetical protein
MSFKKMILPLSFALIIGFLSTSPQSYALQTNQKKELFEVKQEAIQEVIPPPIPDRLSFAGEEVPLQNFDVLESLDRELMVNAYFQSQTMRYLKLAPRYFEIIVPILKEQGIPEDFKYLAMAESGFDAKALSPAGAAGIWQFLKETGKQYGLEINAEVDERYHVEKATLAACKYLKAGYAKYKNWTTVAAAYNAGVAGVERQLNRQREASYYNLMMSDETNRYVFRILSFKTIFEAPEKYGFRVDDADKYPSIPFEIVKVNGPIASLADFAKNNKTNYKLLKMFNPWLRDTLLKNELRKSYEIKIPKGNYRVY